MATNKNGIEVKGVRVNNLKNIDVTIPRNQLTVITGVSGSGKSSLAFDTLYAEGQRRYVESLSAYARQFLGRLSKPECDYIKGLPPAIAIEQKVTARNPRSTVGTSTEIYDYLRLLFARVGKTYSPVSGQEIKKHSTEDVLNCINNFSHGTKCLLLAPLRIVEGRTLTKQLEMYIQEGFARVWYENKVERIDDMLENKHAEKISPKACWLVVDRLTADTSKEAVSRILDSVETAFYEGNGYCRIVILPSNQCFDFSVRFEADGQTFEEPTDQLFSFNSPAGACPQCEGFGSVIGIDERLVIPDTSLSVHDGCVQCWHGDKMGMWQTEFCRRAAKDNFPIFKPYYALTKDERNYLWHGLPSERHLPKGEKICIDSFFDMVSENQYKIQYRVMLSRYRGKTICPTCHGTRLKAAANNVKIAGMSITDLVQMPVSHLIQWFQALELDEHQAQVGKRILTEINSRLKFLSDVGLGYLTLNRTANTLSGGESQRINLTTSIGSSLIGSLYILDEPSIGLHSRDTARLTSVLRSLQQLGNTVIVVEHDEDIIKAADYLIDVGPDAGNLGGEIVYTGPASPSASDTKKFPKSHTLKYLTDEIRIEVPRTRRAWNRHIDLKGCRMNNLKGVDVTIPLNTLTVVTGVSGSGKSSLIKGTLYPALKRHLGDIADRPGDYSNLSGDLNAISKIEFVDQNPIGKSSRSNPATYVKAYDAIRQLFADQPLASQLGFKPLHFSFNTDGGRCPVCKGAGVITVEMQFMADLELTCEECHGMRFQKDVLDVKFQGHNINDVLNMTVDEAIDFFTLHKQKSIANKLLPLSDVGLGYIRLGQSSSTLSGGENQRVKLAYFIGQEKTEPTLFIFDEPTTGLHFKDINKLLKAFNALIERGHSILVIEHHMDVIKCADYVIDIGPEGGDKGGEIVCTGTPEEVAKCTKSYTGRFLKEKLNGMH